MMLKYKVKEYITNGGKVKHFEPLEDADLQKLKHYFERSTPAKLQDELIYSILMSFGERGAEHLQALMDRDTFIRHMDSEGRSYLELKPLDSKNKSYNLKKVG